MDEVTQDRGRDATRARRRLAIALILSGVVHIVPFPGYLLRGMIARSLWPGDETPFEDHGTLIPIELEEQETPSAELPPAEDFEDPEAVAAAAAAKAKKKTIGDAGADAADAADDAADAASDAAPDADAAPDVMEDARAEADAEVDAAPLADDAQTGDGGGLDAAEGGQGEGDAGGMLPPIAKLPRTDPSRVPVHRPPADAAADAPADAPSDAAPVSPIADPVALAGNAASLNRNPNVAAFIYPERIRRHPMGQQFGPVLSRHPQWGSFFANTNLDPIQDTDRIWLAGPQFRDTSQVVAVLRYRVPEARVRAAVEAVVQRSGSSGGWIADAGVPAAKGHADRHDRIFVLPAPNMLVVVPPDGLAAASKVKSIPSLGRNEMFVLSLRSARNALQGVPIDVPASLENLRFAIEGAADGGVNLRISVKDKDGPTAAAEHARSLSQEVDRFALVQVMFAKVRVFEPFAFQARGDVITGETHMNPTQLRNALSAIAAFIDSIPKKAP